MFFGKIIWKRKFDLTLTEKDIRYLHGLERITAKKIYIVKDEYLKYFCSFSLGIRCIIKKEDLHNIKTIKHECIGHSRQSQIHGPAYLLDVGAVSALRNLYQRRKNKDSAWYYNGWPEKDADRRAGVKRT